jgi:hypothetical protein
VKHDESDRMIISAGLDKLIAQSASQANASLYLQDVNISQQEVEGFPELKLPLP